ncbi:hypothetical protein [Catellatospora citrea]|uniref:hypothetical protein n=1 Tax=Catellatospora citrea TaxID=53366 RepID=UPI003F4CD1CA
MATMLALAETRPTPTGLTDHNVRPRWTIARSAAQRPGGGCDGSVWCEPDRAGVPAVG